MIEDTHSEGQLVKVDHKNYTCPNPSFAEGNNTLIQQGWECPKCGAVMAPHMDVCVNCRGSGNNYASGISSGGDIEFVDIDWVKKYTSTGASYITRVDVANENHKVGETYTCERIEK